ncbi:MAG: diguanylate cyclase domain-containing protein [Chroococcales cyanobacterium]
MLSRTHSIVQLSEENLLNLHLDSTLTRLSLYSFQIECSCPGQIVANRFQLDPTLPGVILTEQGRLMGMISRRRFLERMSQPYSLELFLKRPVKCLYNLIQTDFLVLPGNMPIVEAARRALDHSVRFFDEPIVVEVAPQVYRLLDAHELLVAQSSIHQLTTQLMSRLYQRLEKANQELRDLAEIDGLTQVANRRQFDEYLNREWQQLAQIQAPLALIMGDVDEFKAYNDNYGHLAGDDCLRQVAATLKQVVKYPADFVARYGGEEFAVVLPHTKGNGAFCVAEKIRSKMTQLRIPHAHSQVSPYVSVSFGVASVIPSQNLSPQTLIVAADQALYQAKNQGRDRTILYCP